MPSQKESNLPTTICQGRAVKLRGCKLQRFWGNISCTMKTFKLSGKECSQHGQGVVQAKDGSCSRSATRCWKKTEVWGLGLFREVTMWMNPWICILYIFASPPPQGLPFKIKSCFQRKVCRSDFVRSYSYISNVFLNCFQCNVWVSTMCFAMAVKQFFMFNSSFERIKNHW